MNDADKQYRAMHPSQAQQFHADDTQTPESREDLRKKLLLVKQILQLPVREDSSALKRMDAWKIADFVTATVQQSNRELLLNYDAIFQELINCYGYEKAKAIKDGIEIHES